MWWVFITEIEANYNTFCHDYQVEEIVLKYLYCQILAANFFTNVRILHTTYLPYSTYIVKVGRFLLPSKEKGRQQLEPFWDYKK